MSVKLNLLSDVQFTDMVSISLFLFLFYVPVNNFSVKVSISEVLLPQSSEIRCVGIGCSKFRLYNYCNDPKFSDR